MISYFYNTYRNLIKIQYVIVVFGIYTLNPVYN